MTVKYPNLETLIFQHLPIKEKFINPYKNNRIEEITRMRSGILVDTLTSVDIVEKFNCGGIIVDALDGFSCHNIE